MSFNAGGSTDPDGDALTYEWALDGDGVFNDGGGVTKTRTYNGTTPVTVQVRVSDGLLTDTEQVVVSPGNSPPTITGMSPAASLTWAVGETISFSADRHRPPAGAGGRRVLLVAHHRALPVGVSQPPADHVVRPAHRVVPGPGPRVRPRTCCSR